MSKVIQNNVASLQNENTALTTINDNSHAVRVAFENTLSRDGTYPNHMRSNLDMNSNHILNLPEPSNSTEPVRLQDFNNFIALTPTVVNTMPAGGLTGQALTKNSGVSFDASWKEVDYHVFNLKNYATGNGVTDDFNSITNCITAAVNASGSIYIPDGIYNHSGTINWAFNNLRVTGGANVRFVHTGSGVGHSFNGMTNYPGPTQGCAGMVFGGPNRFFLEGNSNTTNLILVDNWHFSSMKIAGKNASNAILFTQNTGVVGASAVSSSFDIKISTNISGGPFTTIPKYGVLLNSVFASVFHDMLIEGVGNVAAVTPGLSLQGSVQNVFERGTVESCLSGGVFVNSSSVRNTFINYDCETNGTQQDWLISGSSNRFVSCGGSGNVNGQYLDGSYNQFINCYLQTMNIQPAANNNIFDSCNLNTTFNDAGVNTMIINNIGLGKDHFYANGGASFYTGSAAPAGGNTVTGINFTATPNFGIIWGQGVPLTSAAQGTIYLRTDGDFASGRMFINKDGSTNWTAVTTAS